MIDTSITTHQRETVIALDTEGPLINRQHIITGWQARVLKGKLRLSILKLALKHYGFRGKWLTVIKSLKEKQEVVHGKSVMNKWVASSGKYFFYMFAPGWNQDSKGTVIIDEMNRIVPTSVKPQLIRFAFFAITKKCPMRCEHCFEWDNINKKEVLAFEDLRSIILKLIDAGISQIHLSGGEPMLRVDDIITLAKEFSGDIEFWILTSGFNVTRDNVRRLKAAGVTGFAVSLDHYEKLQHDTFRRFENAFECATNAIRYAREVDMVVCASVCVTKEFTTKENLYRYLEFAKRLDCSFIQLLEPKAVGHYQGKDVHLSESQLQLLSEFYDDARSARQFNDYPIIIYHGYYNRRVGCFSAGNRTLYIDTNADIMSCPFCHVSSGNMLRDNLTEVVTRMRVKGCADFGLATV